MTDEIIAVVNKTSDYGKFKRLKNNRRVSAQRVAQIKNSLIEKEVINPIIVNGNFEIIEGQGRYEAKKQLGLPIYYIVDQAANEDDCVRLNKNNCPWDAYDYVCSYADSGIESYKILLKLYEETRFPFARMLRFANKSDHPGGVNIIKSGNLEFDEMDAEKVRLLKGKSEDIISALQFTKKPNEAFYTAVKVVTETEGYEHSRMLRKCGQYRNSYAQMSSLEDQLKEFTRIYNKDASSKSRRLYFEDYMRNKGYNTRRYDNIDPSSFPNYHADQPDISTLEMIINESEN